MIRCGGDIIEEIRSTLSRGLFRQFVLQEMEPQPNVLELNKPMGWPDRSDIREFTKADDSYNNCGNKSI